MDNPRNHVQIQLLRALKSIYPNALQAIVIENKLPIINSCRKSTIRNSLTEATHKGFLECAPVSHHEYEAGRMTYRITDAGIEYLDAFLLDLPNFEEKHIVTSSDFELALAQNRCPNLR